MAACAADGQSPRAVQLERLVGRTERLRRLGTRRHECHLTRRVCVRGKQFVLEDAAAAAALLATRVRGVHVGFEEKRLSDLGLFRARNSSEPRPPAYSACVPLVWLPLWGYNIGEFYQSSVLPVAELLSAGVIDRRVMLAPEVGGWPLKDWHVQMLQPFTEHHVASARQLGRRSAPAGGCFERLLFCRFRDVYNRSPPLAPWSAAQLIGDAIRKEADAASWPPPVPQSLSRAPRRRSAAAAAGDAAAAEAAAAEAAWPLPESALEPAGSAPSRRRPFVVLFATRHNAQNGARLISNEAELLEACARWSPPPSCRGGGRPVLCVPHAFGSRGFRNDVRLSLQADVLVGTHGAALLHSLFMPRGSALLEVRPYGFNGRWPDQYHRAMAQQQNATHIFVLRTTDRNLCEPTPPANVSAWDARPLNTRVLPHVFLRALAAAACAAHVAPGGTWAGGAGGALGAAATAGGVLSLAAAPSPAATAPFDYRALRTVYIDNG